MGSKQHLERMMSSETSPPIKSGDIWRHKGSGRIVLVKEIAPSNWPGREGEPVVVYEEVLEAGDFECNFRRYYEPAPKAANTYTKLHAEVKRLREENAELVAAIEANLVPNNDLKMALIGEFQFDILDTDEDGDECSRSVTVPWTTVKDILATIKARIDAALGGCDEA